MAYYNVGIYAFFAYTLKIFKLSSFQATGVANKLTDFVSP
jgi:hypothetical protein